MNDWSRVDSWDKEDWSPEQRITTWAIRHRRKSTWPVCHDLTMAPMLSWKTGLNGLRANPASTSYLSTGFQCSVPLVAPNPNGDGQNWRGLANHRNTAMICREHKMMEEHWSCSCPYIWWERSTGCIPEEKWTVRWLDGCSLRQPGEELDWSFWMCGTYIWTASYKPNHLLFRQQIYKFRDRGDEGPKRAGMTECFRLGSSATACMLLPLKTQLKKRLPKAQSFAGLLLLLQDGKLRR